MPLVQRIAFYGVLVGKTLCARQLVEPVVGLRAHHVVLYLDHLAARRAYERRGVVAVAEVRALLARHLLHILRAVHRLGVHGHQRHHAVAPVEVQRLCHRTQPVGGIHVTAVLHVVAHPPAQLVILAVFPIIVPELVQVMDIRPLCPYHLAEDTVLRHVQRVHLEPVVAAVLQHHAVLARAFAQVNQLPALLQIHGGRHLQGHVLAVLHSIFRNGEVVQPVGGDIHQVNVVALAQGLVALLARVDRRQRPVGVTQVLLALLRPLPLIVTQGHDAGTFYICEAGHRIGAAHPEAHEAYPHLVHLRHRQPQGRLLPRRAFGRFHYNRSFLPMPFRGGRQRLRAQLHGGRRQQGRQAGHPHLSQDFFHVFWMYDE